MSPDVMAYVIASLLADGRGDAAEEAAALSPDAAKALAGEPPPETMADDAPSEPGPDPPQLPTRGQPADDATALAGRDGRALARLIGTAQAAGVETTGNLVRSAVRAYRGDGPLLDAAAVRTLAESLSAVNATAELLGRTRVLDMAERHRSGVSHLSFADEPFANLTLGSVLATPEDALNYFTGLYPSLSLDPERFAGEQRRRAFTLAASANQTLTESVQRAIASSLREGESTEAATGRIADLLDASGASARHPQYAEMVFRTNAADSFQTGVYEQGAADEYADAFPVWQYLGIRDGRQGADHEPHFDRYYPRTAAFAQVRGDRPYNCRCAMRWVDAGEWAELQAAGHRAERVG